MNFDRTFEFHDVEATSVALRGRAQVFAPVQIDDRVEVLRPVALNKALKDRGGELLVLVEDEELPATVVADKEGLRVAVSCEPKKATRLSGTPLELVLRGRVIRKSEKDGVREIGEVALSWVEIRPARGLKNLMADHEERLRAAGASEGDIERTWDVTGGSTRRGTRRGM